MIHSIGKIFVLYSGLCVLQILEDMKKKRIYGSNLINKRPYWPHYIDVEKIKTHFRDKGIGEVDALRGDIENHPLHVVKMK